MVLIDSNAMSEFGFTISSSLTYCSPHVGQITTQTRLELSGLKYAFKLNIFPVDTGRKLNVHKTFRRRRLLNVLCTFNLCVVSTGLPTFLNVYELPKRRLAQNWHLLSGYLKTLNGRLSMVGYCHLILFYVYAILAKEYSKLFRSHSQFIVLSIEICLNSF